MAHLMSEKSPIFRAVRPRARLCVHGPLLNLAVTPLLHTPFSVPAEFYSQLSQDLNRRVSAPATKKTLMVLLHMARVATTNTSSGLKLQLLMKHHYCVYNTPLRGWIVSVETKNKFTNGFLFAYSSSKLSVSLQPPATFGSTFRALIGWYVSGPALVATMSPVTSTCPSSSAPSTAKSGAFPSARAAPAPLWCEPGDFAKTSLEP